MEEVLFYILAIVAVITISISGAFFSSNQEAKSYNKFCDTPVTTWDALWLDLRIDECN